MEVWQMLVIGLLFLILTLFCLKKTIQSFKSKKTIVTKIVLVIMTFFLGFLAFCFLFAGVLSGVFYTFFSELFGGIFKADYWNEN
ncbi:MAG: hypothetical protein KDD21_08745 [Bacteroidetes bacterium]|nr:hypothetical protein [Bacteroidota bacterium]